MLYWLRVGVAWLLRKLANRIDPMGTTPTSLTIGAALPGEQFAAVGTAALRVIADLQEESNSPDVVKAAEAKKKLADWDAFALAQNANNLEAERKEVENIP